MRALLSDYNEPNAGPSQAQADAFADAGLRTLFVAQKEITAQDDVAAMDALIERYKEERHKEVKKPCLCNEFSDLSVISHCR